MPLQFKTASNNFEAWGIIASFLVLEKATYQQKFGPLCEQILAQISLGQYVLALDNGLVVGFATWGLLDSYCENIFQTGLRPLHMLEYKSGSKLVMTNAGTNSPEIWKELSTWFNEELPKLLKKD